MNDQESDMLLNAMGDIHDLATQDCGHFGDDRCTPEEPRCDACIARKAYDAMQTLLTPCPSPLQERRLVNAPERIFWEEWCRVNERHRCLNSGFTALERILNPHPPRSSPFSHELPPPPVSTRDAQVAGAVIQWLGTNCGKCFIDCCERKIVQEKAARAEWDGGLFPYIPQDDTDSPEAAIAKSLADEFVPKSKPKLQQYMAARFFKAFRYLKGRSERVLDCERV